LAPITTRSTPFSRTKNSESRSILSRRYGGDPSPILADAREAFDGEAFLPDDGRQIEVPFPDE